MKKLKSQVVLGLMLSICLILFTACNPQNPTEGGGAAPAEGGGAADITPPYTANHDPAKGATGVNPAANIIIAVLDGGIGVDPDSILMTVNNSTVTPLIYGSGDYYAVLYDPPDFAYGQVVPVTLTAADLNGNAMTQDVYTFTTGTEIGSTPLSVSNCSPEAEAVNVASNTNVYFEVGGDAGVHMGTLSVTVAGQDAIVNGIIQAASYGGEIVATDYGYNVTLNPHAGFNYGQIVTVVVNAADSASRAMPPYSFSFTCVSEGTPPTVNNRDPAPDANEIAINYNIYFEIDDADSGVDVGTINVTVEGQYAVINGVIQSGFDGSIAFDGSGGYDVMLNPLADFAKGQVVDVAIIAADLTIPPNVMPQKRYSFACVNGWSIVDSLAQSRRFHTTTLLMDGRVLVAGGYGTGNLASCEIYDPQTNEWTATGSLNQARYLHAADLLSNGKVLVSGGAYYSGEAQDLAGCEIYDPATGVWSVTGSMNESRFYHRTIRLNDGKVLVSGGRQYNGTNIDLSSCEIYDPVIGVWTITDNLSQARCVHTMTKLTDGRILTVGGYNGSTISGCELYDPAVGTWSNTGNLNQARSSHAAVLLDDGQVLAIAGYRNLSSCELYNPDTGAWTLTGSLNQIRLQHFAAKLGDGRVIIVGGNSTSIVSTCEVYDPAVNQWSAAESMNQARNLFGATLLNDGRLLVAGGNDGENIAGCEVYGYGSLSDTTPPEVKNRVPESGVTGVVVTSNISFEIDDNTGTGVDLATLNVTIEGENAILGGVIQAGYSGTVLGNGAGGFEVNINPGSDFSELHVVDVVVDAADNAANVMTTESYSFTCEGVPSDSIPPTLSNRSPGPGATSIATNTSVYFELDDTDSGVDASSLIVTVEGVYAVLEGFILSDFSGSIVDDGAGGYDVTIYRAIVFDNNQVVDVVINVSDTAANDMTTVSYSFTTLVGPDASPPFASNLSPVEGAVEVDPSSNIVLHVQDLGAGVDHSTIVMTVEGAAVDPSITGTAADYTLTYNPAADFASEQVVDVSVSASDLVGNAMTPIEYSFSAAMYSDDTNPPTLSSVNPGSGATNVIISTNISFEVDDGETAVDGNSLNVTIEGTDVIINGIPQNNAYVSTVAPDGDGGFDVFINPNSDFNYSQVVGVVIEVADLGGNLLTENYIFTCLTSTDGWVVTGQMTERREYHTMTLLNNGQLLVTGGYNNTSRYLSSCELYDPDTGAWSATSSMIQERQNHTATLLADGQVLVAGGYYEDDYQVDPPLSSCEIYDPFTGMWTATGSMYYLRNQHSATLLTNGRVLVVGGQGNNDPASCELYDPDTGTWSITGSMINSRQYPVTVLLANGRVLAVDGDRSHWGPNNECELYDPDTGEWTATGSFNVTRYRFSLVLLPDGRVLVAGGLVNSSLLRKTCEVYDPDTGAWSFTGDLTYERYQYSATLLNDGRVLVAGLYSTGSSCEVYDPATGTWSTTDSLNYGRSRHPAAKLANGWVFVAGGASYRSDCEYYTYYTAADTLAPTVNNLSPAAAEVEVIVNRDITFETNDPFSVGGSTSGVDVASLSVTVDGSPAITNGGFVAGFDGSILSVALGRIYVTIDPDNNLANGQLIDIVVNVSDRFGNAMAPISWSFTTIAADTFAPAVSNQNPAPGSTDNVMRTNVYFEIDDVYLGVDLSTLSVSVEGENVIVAGVPQAGNYAASVVEDGDGGYDVTINPHADFTYAQVVDVVIDASDLIGNAMATVSYSFDCAYPSDNTAPTLSNQSPGSGAPSVPVMTNIRFNIDDSQSGLDLSSLNVTVEGGNAIVNGVIQSGYGGQIVADGVGGLNVRLNPDTDFSDQQVVDIVVNVQDFASNSLNASYYFTCVVPAPGWAVTGSNNREHAFNKSVLLADGQVLIVGALGSWYSLPYCEIYNPLTGDWTPTGNLNVARDSFSITLLSDTRVLAVGGYYWHEMEGTIYHYSSEIWDPATEVWSYTANMIQGRQSHSSVKLTDGRVLVTGGKWHDGSSWNLLSHCEIYDPAAGTWTVAASLNQARKDHLSALLPDGRVLVFGGRDTSDTLASCEIYDPVSDTWSSTGSMNTGRYYEYTQNATSLSDGSVLAVGGQYFSTDLISCEIFDPVTETWSYTTSLDVPRQHHTVTLLNNGKVLVTGGYYTDNLSSCLIYDPSTETWSATYSMNKGRNGNTAILLNDGRVLSVAGFTNDDFYFKSCEVYQPD